MYLGKCILYFSSFLSNIVSPVSVQTEVLRIFVPSCLVEVTDHLYANSGFVEIVLLCLVRFLYVRHGERGSTRWSHSTVTYRWDKALCIRLCRNTVFILETPWSVRISIVLISEIHPHIREFLQHPCQEGWTSEVVLQWVSFWSSLHPSPHPCLECLDSDQSNTYQW